MFCSFMNYYVVFFSCLLVAGGREDVWFGTISNDIISVCLWCRHILFIVQYYPFYFLKSLIEILSAPAFVVSDWVPLTIGLFAKFWQPVRLRIHLSTLLIGEILYYLKFNGCYVLFNLQLKHFD